MARIRTLASFSPAAYCEIGMRRTKVPMKTIRSYFALILAFALLSALSAGSAFAQADEPLAACEGDTVTGTVVAVDENTGEVTLELDDGSLCSVHFGQDFEHPITSLLGAYFDGLSMDELEDHVENLEVEVVCDEVDGCVLAGDDDDVSDMMMVRITGITDNGDGSWTIDFTYMDDEGNPQADSFTTDDPFLAESWMESLGLVTGDFALVTDEEGNVFFEGAGDEIQSLHEDGMGFGVIVKLFAMASEAERACDAAAFEPEPAEPTEDTFDPCTVSVAGLVEEFRSGTGLGRLFQTYGKPAILGIGHIRNGSNGNGTPPDNACGYWRNHGDGYLPDACQDSQGGKPPWAGTPGGPNGNGGHNDDE